MYVLGSLLLIVLLLVILLLVANVRMKQLQREKYSDRDRFLFINKLCSWAIPFIFRIKVEVKGLEKLEAVEKGVLYPNHQSNLDIAALLKVINRPHGYVAKKELDNIFLLSDGMRLIQCQFMDRDDVRQAVKVISEATKSVKAGHLMVIFPEGTRKIRGEMGSFKAGSFKIAQKAKADIIPVTIYNSYEVVKRWPKMTMIKMEIHNPIPYHEYHHLTTGEISEMVEKIVKYPL